MNQHNVVQRTEIGQLTNGFGVHAVREFLFRFGFVHCGVGNGIDNDIWNFIQLGELFKQIVFEIYFIATEEANAC